MMTTVEPEATNSQAEVLIHSAIQAGLIEADWESNGRIPSNSEISQAVGALKLGVENGSDPLTVIQIMAPYVRPYALMAFLPSVVVGPPVVLRRNWQPWNHKFNSANGSHWLNLRQHLIDNLDWSLARVNDLDRSSDEVLFNLQDPDMNLQPEEPVKGLVVGYVQSGKTANYTATAAKAFDAGYRLVVVLAGMHNELRRQTQRRMEDELGLIASSPSRLTSRPNGQVGLANPIVPLTDELSDRGYTSVGNSIINNQSSIAIIKKNVAVLKAFLRWLPQDFDHPVLIIDDEADQASVNSNSGTEMIQLEDGSMVERRLERSATNQRIVELIERYSPRLTYVGYTATPYANVFTDAEESENIYPRDFILSLPKPSGYFGPKEFFGDLTAGGEAETSPNSYSMVCIVDDEDAQVFKDAAKRVREGRRGQPTGPIDVEISLPESLKSALMMHLLAVGAFRAAKSREVNAPTSMLVHVSHIQDVQVATANAIRSHLNELMTNWRYYRETSEGTWKSSWEEFSSTHVSDDFARLSWSQIESELTTLMGFNVETICLNSSSDDVLDYERNPELCAVIVGGNKLSRGLTLEGLITSYFVRETSAPKADTLSQMGRFFGYREEYADLVRVYTTDSLLQDFKDVSLIEEELREELALYSRLPGKTPADFGPRVALRGRLMPTGNIGSGNVAVSLSGSLLQTTQLIREVDYPNDEVLGQNKANEALITSCLADWKEYYVSSSPSQVSWQGIAWSSVNDLLGQFNFSRESNRFNPELIKRHVETEIKSEAGFQQNGVDHSTWNVALIGRNVEQVYGRNFVHPDYDFEIGQITRSLRVAEAGDIGALINPLSVDTGNFTIRGDETVDLNLDAEDVASLTSDTSLTKQMTLRLKFRKRPLLCIYPISPESTGSSTNRSPIPLGEALFGHDRSCWPKSVIGIAIVFPRSSEEAVGYMTGNAGRLSP